MSRVAKNPVAIPQGVEVMISDAEIAVKGPLGTLRQALSGAVQVAREGDAIVCKARDGVENAQEVNVQRNPRDTVTATAAPRIGEFIHTV